jgi:hypothetical protein
VLDVVGQQAPDAENDVPQRCRAISLFTAVLIASPRQRSSHLRYPRLLSLDRAVAKHAGKQGADSGPRVVSGQRVPMESGAATLSFIRSSFYNLSSAGQRRKEFLWKDRQAAGNYPDCGNDFRQLSRGGRNADNTSVLRDWLAAISLPSRALPPLSVHSSWVNPWRGAQSALRCDNPLVQLKAAANDVRIAELALLSW